MSDLNNRPTVVTKDDRGRAEKRFYAFSALTVTAVSPETGQLVVSAGDNEVVEVTSLCISNSAATDQSVNFAVVDKGGGPSDANTVIREMSIGARSVAQLERAIMLNPGQSLYAYANPASAGHLRVSGWLTVYL